MNKKERRIFSIGLLLVLLTSFLLVQSVLGIKVDRILRDKITDTHTRNEVLVIGIDDASLKSIGAWPWDRGTFAQAIDILYKKGARLVVFDVLFLEKRNGDDKVRSTLESNKKEVIFASKFNAKQELVGTIYNDSPYAKNGVAHVYPDDDGKVRSVVLSQKDNLGNCYNSLAYQAFLVYSRNTSTVCDTELREFLYQEKPQKTLSFIDVVNTTIPDEAIRDKVIFIGSNSLDIEDNFIGQDGEKIAGVYIHANIFSTLLNNSFLTPFQKIYYIFFIVLFLVGALFITLRIRNPLMQGAFALGGALVIVVLTIFLMSLHYMISLSTLLFPYVLVSLYAIMYRYSVTERKNNYIKELFGQYVHPKVLTTILNDNNLVLGGEKKYITILFSDIRGFTTMTEKMSPEKLVETLNMYLEKMSPIIMENEGVIDKYIGDAIMAFWNAPVDVSNHEEKAVRASLAMIDALHEIQKIIPLEIGIGLHAGEAIVGNIGSRKRINYTIIGDAVNACSRLEGLTKKYGLQIIVSEQIKNAITADDIVWRSIDSVRVKGKTEVMKLFQPMKRTSDSEATIKITEEAFKHYTVGEFKDALPLYNSVNDTYSKKMIDRIEGFIKKAPVDWNGTWDWDEK